MAPSVFVTGIQIIPVPNTQVRTYQADEDHAYEAGSANSDGEILFQNDKGGPPYEFDNHPFKLRKERLNSQSPLGVTLFDKVSYRVGNQYHAMEKNGTGTISLTLKDTLPMSAQVCVFEGCLFQKSLSPRDGARIMWRDQKFDFPVYYEYNYMSHPDAPLTTPEMVSDCPLKSWNLNQNVVVKVGKVSHHYMKQRGLVTLIHGLQGKFDTGSLSTDFSVKVDGVPCENLGFGDPNLGFGFGGNLDTEPQARVTKLIFDQAVQNKSMVSIDLAITHNDPITRNDPITQTLASYSSDDEDGDDYYEEGPFDGSRTDIHHGFEGMGDNGSSADQKQGGNNHASEGSNEKRKGAADSGTGNALEEDIGFTTDDLKNDFKMNCDGDFDEYVDDFRVSCVVDANRCGLDRCGLDPFAAGWIGLDRFDSLIGWIV